LRDPAGFSPAYFFFVAFFAVFFAGAFFFFGIVSFPPLGG
jgi:hypothetical protein